MAGSVRIVLLVSMLLATSVAAQHPLDPAAGKALFERNWVAAPASTAASDGLGPYFNARSCAACHPLAGRGDTLQALVIRTDSAVFGRQLQPHALPGLVPESSFQIDFMAAMLPSGAEGRQVLVVTPAQLPASLSPRFAPSLKGLGVLASVPDRAIMALADPDDTNGDGISGRQSLIRDPLSGQQRTGRFGWKAEHADLDAQIAAAFSLDLGLGSPYFPSPFGDCTILQEDCLRGVSGAETGVSATEIDARIITLIREYLLSLAVQSVQGEGSQGLELFHETGCAACHMPVLDAQQTAPMYSDLLLHDMGHGLSAGFSTRSAEASEWRTAPLKDLEDSEYLLHDGRATSVDEAVGWHDGEAAVARQAYLELNEQQKSLLLSFLNGL